MNRKFPSVPWCLLLVAISVPWWTGCGPKSQPTGKPKVSSGPKVNLLSAQWDRLEKEPSEAICREVLMVVENSDNEALPAMPEADQKRLLELIPLRPDEIKTVASVNIGPNDSRYLEECLLLNAIIRGMDLGKYPPQLKVRLLFDWVCRQIHLYLDNRTPEFAVPPWFALHAGRGTPADRAHVFLSLLNQLNLDGCLIGTAEMRKQPLTVRIPTPQGDKYQFNFPPLVGVRLEKDIWLFNPESGKPIFGSDGKTILTLAQLRASPEKFVDQISPNLNPESVKKWEVALTCPMEGLSPRMKWIQEESKEVLSVVLTWDAEGLRNRFRKEAGETVGCEFWCHPQDTHALARIGTTFHIPRTEQGRTFTSAQRFTESFVPLQFCPVLLVGGRPVGGHGQYLVNTRFGDPIRNLQFRFGSPRDHILRAQFRDATVVLEEIRSKQDGLRQQAAVAGNLATAWEEWTKIALDVYANYSIAQDSGDPVLMESAKAELTRLDKNPYTPKALLLVDRESGRFQAAEASYWLALGVHEQAERLQARHDQQPSPQLRTEAENKWRSARDWWQSYLNNHADVRVLYQIREAHARKLLTRCDEYLPKTSPKP